MSNHEFRDTYHRIFQTLNGLSRELVSNGSIEDMLRKVVAAGVSLLPMKVCSLWQRDAARDPGEFRLETVWGVDDLTSFPRSLKLSGSISRRAIETHCSQAVPDLDLAPASPEKTIAMQRGLTALICVPVLGAGPDPVGLLLGFGDTPDAFSEMDIQVAEALAQQVGIVWHMAELRGDAHRLREDLQTRKQVDRAKEILMDRRKMSAEDAYRWIQKRSMDSRRSMRDVAETIILSDVSGHYTSIPHALDLLNKPSRK